MPTNGLSAWPTGSPTSCSQSLASLHTIEMLHEKPRTSSRTNAAEGALVMMHCGHIVVGIASPTLARVYVACLLARKAVALAPCTLLVQEKDFDGAKIGSYALYPDLYCSATRAWRKPSRKP